MEFVVVWNARWLSQVVRTLQIRYPVKITTPGARTTSLMGNPHPMLIARFAPTNF